jgi:hypothetical protein
MENKTRLQQALDDIDADSYDFELAAHKLNNLLVGYSLFWGTNSDGEVYLEWYNDGHHAVTLTYF